MDRRTSSCSASSSSRFAPPAWEEKVPGSRRTRTTSPCRVRDQKPCCGAGSSFQCSGSEARSSSNMGHARPASKASRSVRSTTGTSRPGQIVRLRTSRTVSLPGMAGQEGDPEPGRRYEGAVLAPGASGGEHRTLAETERAVAERLDGLALDMPAMAVVQNLYRAAGAIRNHLERSVLAPHSLTWTGWVVLWVVWIWADIEARHVAAEAGISKGTLTGVLSTLESRGLLVRRTHPGDARRVLVALTPP